MPRCTLDTPLGTRAARDRLQPGPKCYWRGLGAGAALGYRKGKQTGSWLVRVSDASAGGGYRQHALGPADDMLKADGSKVLDYRHAENAARDWIARHHRIANGLEPEPSNKPAAPYTVKDAIADYLADYEARGGKALPQTRTAINAHIIPKLGTHFAVRLTREQIRTWHRQIANSAARTRGKAGSAPKLRDIANEPDARRRRQSSANRILTILKAALNHAREEGRIAGSGDAWTAVKAFREADRAKIRYLQDDEITRLVNACSGDFRALVSAALLTGCRYGELAALQVSDFDHQARTVRVGRSKSGKARHVALTDEGRDFFEQSMLGRQAAERIFMRDAIVKQATRKSEAERARVGWGKSDQFRPIKDACVAANIKPAISFHELRHTYASRLATRGVAMGVIAAQLGHSDTRMTERHYAHLSPSYIADTVRSSFGTLGIVKQTAVALLKSRSATLPNELAPIASAGIVSAVSAGGLLNPVRATSRAGAMDAGDE